MRKGGVGGKRALRDMREKGRRRGKSELEVGKEVWV